MIQTFVNAFSAFWDGICQFFDIIVGWFNNFIIFFKFMFSGAELVTFGFQYLPQVLYSVALITLIISLIMMILGRNIGGSE